jgi:hypothetical protein
MEVINYRGIDINIYEEDMPMTPNDWDTDEACLVYDHRDFCSEPTLHGYKLDSSWCQVIFEDWSSGRKTVEFNGVHYWIFPVFAYIHSGVVLYLSRSEANRWEPTGFDTSFKGFALVSKQYPRNWKKEDAKKEAQDLLDIWNQLLSGEVYGYYSEYGSCTGFYGDKGREQMIAEAKQEIDSGIKEKILI